MEDLVMPIALVQRSYHHLNAAGEEFQHLPLQDLENTNDEVQLKGLAKQLRKINEAAKAIVELATMAHEYVNWLIATARNALNLAELLHEENHEPVQQLFG